MAFMRYLYVFVIRRQRHCTLHAIFKVLQYEYSFPKIKSKEEWRVLQLLCTRRYSLYANTTVFEKFNYYFIKNEYSFIHFASILSALRFNWIKFSWHSYHSGSKNIQFQFRQICSIADCITKLAIVLIRNYFRSLNEQHVYVGPLGGRREMRYRTFSLWNCCNKLWISFAFVVFFSVGHDHVRIYPSCCLVHRTSHTCAC